MLQACLNGVRRPDQHPAIPVTPDEIAAAATAAVAAGAEMLHIHPKDADGRDSLDPDIAAAALLAVRASVPGVPVGTTTGAWAASDAATRHALIESWRVLPDFASVNWHEDGATDVAVLLLDRRVGVEAGVWTGAIARAFATSPIARRCLRVMGEPMEQDPAAAVATGDAITAAVAGLGLPILLHGMDAGTWPVLRVALDWGLDVRIGLEDVLSLPDGAPAPDNAALVHAVRALGG